MADSDKPAIPKLPPDLVPAFSRAVLEEVARRYGKGVSDEIALVAVRQALHGVTGGGRPQ